MDRLTVRTLETARTARIAVLGDGVADPRELWVVLHGYRQLADRFVPRFAPLDDGTRRIVAPEALSRFYVDEDGGPHGPDHRVGASWMTRHDREAEIRDYVRYLDAVVEDERARGASAALLVVLGFSQGAHTAARWIVEGRGPAPRLTVLWGAPLPGDLDPVRAPARLGATRLVRVRGRRDPLRRPAAEDAEDARLVEWGLPSDVLEHDGGHEIRGHVLRSLAAGLGDGGSAEPLPAIPGGRP